MGRQPYALSSLEQSGELLHCFLNGIIDAMPPEARFVDGMEVYACYFANEIEMVNYKENWYSCCKVSEFIQKHRMAFDKFMKEVNNERYQPDDKVTIDDEEFCDLYLITFESLVCGNYADKDYELLYELLLTY